MAAIQESTRPTPQIIPAQVPSKSDIPGDAASPTSQYSTEEYENSSGHAGQHATDDRNSPSISTQREGHLSDLRRRETSTGEDGVNNEENQANVAGGEDSEEE
jgi:hypothetical protein